ncbi:glycosyltransferase [Planctopirus hydrillae]|uniref:Glycosyltransferase 2-like domain-containing protein n=1 Tax=Planctopirus hydrillae TaxID=1841610 RepID=A0A1C3E4A7_9PLAN|nr:glycosyltransferase [Planctopirus hydrillae]ODA28082.1 hypothetical protein A6X21_14570 [Planctopirus hydrillae]
MKPILTIGIPTCDDQRALWFTLIDLQRTRRDLGLTDQVEILVISQSAKETHIKAEREHVAEIQNARYLHLPEPQGAGPAKQAVFDHATGNAVCCIDSHVILDTGVLARLVAFAATIDDGLYFGPNLRRRLINADGKPAIVGTHYLPRYGGNGNWGDWATHPSADNPHAAPFEINSCGTGCFVAKRETFLGFHAGVRGHGGIEPYIPQKYRQAGRSVKCLPWLRWIHLYGYSDGSPYKGFAWSVKARNDLLGFAELGYPSFQMIQSNYTAPGRLSLDRFTEIAREVGALDRLQQMPAPAALQAAPAAIPDSDHRRLIIGVLSADNEQARYRDKREAIRQTWGKDLPEDVELVFLVGRPDLVALPDKRGDMLLLPCPDDYQHLTEKTIWFCRWLVANRKFSRVLKCDDDTYVHVQRILGRDRMTADYVGTPTPQRVAAGRPFETASGGAGYLLSPRAVSIVAASEPTKEWQEDVHVAQVLHAAGINLTKSRQFHAGKQTIPGPDNQQVTAHYVTPERMREIYLQLGCLNINRDKHIVIS